MAVVPVLVKPGRRPAPGATGEATVVVNPPLRAPRALPTGTLAYTRRELAGRSILDSAFRELYTVGLPELGAGNPIVIGITSAVRGEGRTTTSLGLALAIARDLDARVLLVELDLERPTLARDLRLPTSPGLVEVLTQNVRLDAAMRRLDACGVDLLPTGSAPHAISRLVRSAVLREFLALARRSYDAVVLDLPPALGNSDVVPLGGLTDALLIVVRAGVTPKRLAEQATARFAGAKVRGVVLTGHRSAIPNWLRRLF